MYNDFVHDPREFEKNNVLYHYPVNGDQLKIGKEEIIQSVLRSKTKQQVNNKLMKHFPNKEVSVIYQRLRPLIKDLPGK